MYQKRLIYQIRYIKNRADSNGRVHTGGAATLVRKTESAARHGARVLEDVVQLPHVARPCVREEDLLEFRRQTSLRLPSLRGELRQDPVRHLLDVLPPVAQGRDPDRNHVSPVVQVRAELPLADEFL